MVVPVLAAAVHQRHAVAALLLAVVLALGTQPLGDGFSDNAEVRLRSDAQVEAAVVQRHVGDRPVGLQVERQVGIAREQVEVVGERRRVPRVGERAEHLRVRDDAPRVPAREGEQAAEQCRLVHAREQEDVARHGRLDERVESPRL